MNKYFRGRESREDLFASFKQKVVGSKCQENLKSKISREFKVASCWKGRKI